MSKERVTWGLLYHLLGLRGPCAKELSPRGTRVSGDAIGRLSRAVLELNDNWDAEAEARQSLRLAIAIAACDVLSPPRSSEPRLAMECGRLGRETRGSGYSRGPFRPISERNLDNIALAVTCYLVRGHSLLFGRPRAGRDYNVVRTALNDLHQAYHLSWRLYQNLRVNHQSGPTIGLDQYLDTTAGFSGRRVVPARSPYFIWASLLLCEIFRGNAYNQVHYLDEADRHYRHAEARLNMVIGRGKLRRDRFWPEQCAFIVSPTAIRALYSRSKVLFDMGQFLESLQAQVRCLEFILRFGADSSNASEARRLLATLLAISQFAEAERAPSEFDREKLSWYFGNDRASYWPRRQRPRIRPLTPERFRPFVRPEHERVATGVMTRIGFTLFTLRPKRLSRRAPDRRNARELVARRVRELGWLSDYVRFDKLLWSDQGRPRRNPLGVYCETLFSLRPSNPLPSFGEPDRQLALLLRNTLRPPRRRPENQELAFYKSILESTTENISNIVTIPRRNREVLLRRGYRFRRTRGDLSQRSVKLGLTLANENMVPVQPPMTDKAPHMDKFVVLRRWQSFNPKIPRPDRYRLRGGGYFLLWHHKGIVIDPGYDFIQNFYDEGFSLEDINAIIVTHSHPDHDDELATLITLIREWNEYYSRIGQAGLSRTIDVFLNESAHWKFAAWLQASGVRVGRVIPIPLICWSKNSASSQDPKSVRGKNVVIDLRRPRGVAKGLVDAYDMVIEIVPAWHDDVIGRAAAVGLKFHLYQDGRPVGAVGYTGDTGAYGLEIGRSEPQADAFRIDLQYRGCDVLVAHLGDIKLRELASTMRAHDPAWGRPRPMMELLKNHCGALSKPQPKGAVRWAIWSFLEFITTLDVVPEEARTAIIPAQDPSAKGRTALEYLGDYLRGDAWGWSDRPASDVMPWLALEPVASDNSAKDELRDSFLTIDMSKADDADKSALRILSFVCASTALQWQYPYHLGIFGVYKLFEAMVRDVKSRRRRKGRAQPGLFIVGELPEELTSYRHKVAFCLNALGMNAARRGAQHVHAYTADIGLHIRLAVDSKKRRIDPQIRCMYCNYNNELVIARENYHPPAQILETPIKRSNSAMVYLCLARDHHPERESEPRHFLNRPELRGI